MKICPFIVLKIEVIIFLKNNFFIMNALRVSRDTR